MKGGLLVSIAFADVSTNNSDWDDHYRKINYQNIKTGSIGSTFLIDRVINYDLKGCTSG